MGMSGMLEGKHSKHKMKVKEGWHIHTLIAYCDASLTFDVHISLCTLVTGEFGDISSSSEGSGRRGEATTGAGLLPLGSDTLIRRGLGWSFHLNRVFRGH